MHLFDAKALPHSSTKTLNRYGHLLFGSSRKRCTEEHLSLDKAITLSQEPAAFANENTLADGGEEDLFFELRKRLRLGVGMEVPVDFQPELKGVKNSVRSEMSERDLRTCRQREGPMKRPPWADTSHTQQE